MNIICSSKNLFLALAMLGAASTSSAALVKFKSTASVYDLGDGLTLNITATGGNIYSYASPNPIEYGIGVGGNAADGGLGYNGSSYVTTETLTLTFNQVVNLDTIAFFQWENPSAGTSDRLTLAYSGGTASGSKTLTNSGMGTVTVDEFLLSGVSGTTFKLTPVQTPGVNQTSFYVQGLNYTPTVPVPAAAWLFGSSLLGLAGMSRRRAA